MFTGIAQSAIIMATALAFYLIDLLMALHYDRLRQTQSSSRNWRYLLFSLFLVFLLVAQPLLWPWLGLHIMAWWGVIVQSIGLLIILIALGVNIWARFHLGQFYTQRGEILPEHRLIESGPYAYVRHPLFTTYFLLVTGIVLVNPSIPALLVAFYTLWEFSKNAKRDEQLLLEHLPAYDTYMRRIPRFFPRFVRLHRT